VTDLRPPAADGLLAAALVAFGVVEVVGHPLGQDVVQGPTWLNLLTVTAFGLPVAWRRRAPLAAVLVVHVAVGLRALHDQPLELYAPVFASLIGAYSLGVHGRLRSVLPALAVSAAALATAQERGTGGDATPDAVAMLVLLGVLWAIGRVIGRRSSESAAALQRAQELDRRRAEEAAAAVAAERRRIAHELHDAVSHSLAMITMQAGGAQDVVATDPDRAVESLRTIEDAARRGLAEMRQLLGLLDESATREPGPDLDRLPALLEGARAAGVDARLRTTGTPQPVSAGLGATVPDRPGVADERRPPRRPLHRDGDLRVDGRGAARRGRQRRPCASTAAGLGPRPAWDAGARGRGRRPA
jgi:signal transduction histidine kinase